MRAIHWIGLGLVVTGAAACGKSGTATTGIEGKPAPDALLTPVKESGKAIKVSDLKGKVVVLDFWATWCGPCMAIMPQMSALQERYKDRGLVVLGVTDENAPKVREWLAGSGKKITYDLVIDAVGAANRGYQVTSLPTTVLIGRDGVVRRKEEGFDSNVGVLELQNAVEAALKEQG